MRPYVQSWRARTLSKNRRTDAGRPTSRHGLAVALGLSFVPAAAAAHPGEPLAPHDLWTAWSFEPLVLLGLGLAITLYARGVRHVWRRAGRGRGVTPLQVRCFAGGIACLFVALVSPLDAVGGSLFVAHMTQHVLLMGVAAPLLVLGAPLTAMTWALRRERRRDVARVLGDARLRAAGRFLAAPAAAWLVHAAVIWIWHAPPLYSASVMSDVVHTIQHMCFMIAALLFWWALRDRATHGIAVLYLFTTAVHSSILGALLTFAPEAYYSPYATTAPLWNLTPLEDQQLGGLIMWVPGGLVYFFAALGLLAAWLRRSEAHTDRAHERIVRPASWSSIATRRVESQRMTRGAVERTDEQRSRSMSRPLVGPARHR